MNKMWGNCSIYSIDPESGDYPASDVWYHGGVVSMRDPEWFWHIPHPEAYWYKGDVSTRGIDSQRWAIQVPEHHSHPEMVFEWEFANEDWTFYDGERPDQR